MSSIRFLLVGVLNTCVGLGTIFLLKFAFDAQDILANIIGYCIGIMTSFFLNARWTFAYRESLPAVFHRFLAVTAAGYSLNLIVVYLALYQFGVNSYLSHVVGLIPYTLFTYWGSRYFVFRYSPHGANSQ